MQRARQDQPGRRGFRGQWAPPEPQALLEQPALLVPPARKVRRAYREFRGLQVPLVRRVWPAQLERPGQAERLESQALLERLVQLAPPARRVLRACRVFLALPAQPGQRVLPGLLVLPALPEPPVK